MNGCLPEHDAGHPSMRQALSWLMAATLGKSVIVPLCCAVQAALVRLWPGAAVIDAAAVAEVLYKLALVAGPAALYIRSDPAARAGLRLKRMRGASVSLTAAAAVTGVLLSAALSSLWARLLTALGGQITSTITCPATAIEALWQMLLYALLPGVCEELLFRGGLMSAWEMGSRRTALIAQAVLFALFHESLQGGWVQLVMGLVLGYVVQACDSLYAGMLFHTLFNALTLLWAWMTETSGITLNGIFEQHALLMISGIVMFWLLGQMKRPGQTRTMRETSVNLTAQEGVLLALCVLKMLLLGAEDALRVFGVL